MNPLIYQGETRVIRSSVSGLLPRFAGQEARKAWCWLVGTSLKRGVNKNAKYLFPIISRSKTSFKVPEGQDMCRHEHALLSSSSSGGAAC